MSVRFAKPALEEARRQVRHYEARQSGLGNRFWREVQNTAALLEEFPEIGSPGGKFRSARVHGFPFSLHYAIEEEVIVILAVAHDARSPGYWKPRL